MSNATPTIHFSNKLVLDAVDRMAERIGTSRSKVITYLLTQVLNAYGDATPIVSETGIRYDLRVTLEFEEV